MATNAERLAPIYAAMGPHLATPPLMHNATFDPSGVKALLEGNTVQMVTVEVPPVGVKGGKWEQSWWR